MLWTTTGLWMFFFFSFLSMIWFPSDSLKFIELIENCWNFMLLFTVKRREERHIVISLALRCIFANFVCIWLQQENCINIKSYINKAVRRCGLVLCWHCFVFFPDVRCTESHWKQFSAQLLFNVICSTSLWLFEKKIISFHNLLYYHLFYYKVYNFCLLCTTLSTQSD